MTRSEWAKLSPGEQRIKIATLCGWCRLNDCTFFTWVTPLGQKTGDAGLPDYLNDLNAMHEAETLAGNKYGQSFTYDGPLYGENDTYICCLERVVWDGYAECEKSRGDLIQATAEQRAEAFVLCVEAIERRLKDLVQKPYWFCLKCGRTSPVNVLTKGGVYPCGKCGAEQSKVLIYENQPEGGSLSKKE